MNKIVAVLVVFACAGLAGCSSAEKKAAKADAAYTEEKTKTLQEYKECIKDADDDEKELAACEQLLKAVQAVEGGGQ
jgi:hypothetical protein